MHKRPLGNLQVSVVGLGCNNFGSRLDEMATKNVLDAALDAGVNFFDTADVYSQGESELFLGRVLKGRRNQILLATKFGSPYSVDLKGAHPDTIKRALPASLKRLQMDHVDLYQLHRPDPDVPIADTIGALTEFVKQGLVREIGCSHFSAEQLLQAESAASDGGSSFASVQNEYSMLKREARDSVLPTCDRLGIAFLPYFPLYNGLLTGKYRKGKRFPKGARITQETRWEGHLTKENLDLIERLATFAKARGRELLDLAFSWILTQQSVASVIAGATSVQQITRNSQAGNWTLSAEDLAEVDAILG